MLTLFECWKILFASLLTLFYFYRLVRRWHVSFQAAFQPWNIHGTARKTYIYDSRFQNYHLIIQEQKSSNINRRTKSEQNWNRANIIQTSPKSQPKHSFLIWIIVAFNSKLMTHSKFPRKFKVDTRPRYNSNLRKVSIGVLPTQIL